MGSIEQLLLQILSQESDLDQESSQNSVMITSTFVKKHLLISELVLEESRVC